MRLSVCYISPTLRCRCLQVEGRIEQTEFRHRVDGSAADVHPSFHNTMASLEERKRAQAAGYQYGSVIMSSQLSALRERKLTQKLLSLGRAALVCLQGDVLAGHDSRPSNTAKTDR